MMAHIVLCFLLIIVEAQGLTEEGRGEKLGFEVPFLKTEVGIPTHQWIVVENATDEDVPWIGKLKFSSDFPQIRPVGRGGFVLEYQNVADGVLYKTSLRSVNYCNMFGCHRGNCSFIVKESSGNFSLSEYDCSPFSLKCFNSLETPLLLADLNSFTNHSGITVVDCYSIRRFIETDSGHEAITCASSFTTVADVIEVQSLGCKKVEKEELELGCATKEGFRHKCHCEESLCNDPTKQIVPVGNTNNDIMQSIRQLKIDLFEKVKLIKDQQQCSDD